MQVLDEETMPEQFYNVLLYGPPGSGKTSFGVTAPGPVLFLLSELQGYYHLKQACVRLGVPMPTVLQMHSIEEYAAVSKALHAPPNEFHTLSISLPTGVVNVPRPRTLVIDSFSDAGKLLVRDLEQRHPPQTDQDGLPKKKFSWWNVLKEKTRGMIRAFRDAPCHVVFLCELEDKVDGDDDAKTRHIGPVLPVRSTVVDLAHAVNVVGVSYRTLAPRKDANGQRVVDFGVMTTGPQHVVTKPLRPLRDIEEPDFSSWVARLNGEVVDVHTLTPPQEHLEGMEAGEPEGAEVVQAAAPAPPSQPPAGPAVPPPSPVPEGEAKPKPAKQPRGRSKRDPATARKKAT